MCVHEWPWQRLASLYNTTTYLEMENNEGKLDNNKQHLDGIHIYESRDVAIPAELADFFLSGKGFPPVCCYLGGFNVSMVR